MLSFLKKSILAISAILGILFFLILSFLIFINYFVNPCENKLISEVPMGKGLEVVLFKRGCGATTGYSYHMSIVDENYKIGNRDVGELVVFSGEYLKITKTKGEVLVYFAKEGKFHKKIEVAGITYVEN